MPAELAAMQTKIIGRQAAAAPAVTTVATTAAATHTHTREKHFFRLHRLDLYGDGRPQRRFADSIAAVLHTNSAARSQSLIERSLDFGSISRVLLLFSSVVAVPMASARQSFEWQQYGKVAEKKVCTLRVRFELACAVSAHASVWPIETIRNRMCGYSYTIAHSPADTRSAMRTRQRIERKTTQTTAATTQIALGLLQ